MASKCDAKVTPYAGLKANCRHLAARKTDGEKNHFCVGTAIVGKSNQIQILEYDDMQESVQCLQVIDHKDEVWWIECNPNDSDILVTISANSATSQRVATILRIPPPDTLSTALGTPEHQQFEEISVFGTKDPTPFRALYMPPDQSRLLLSCKGDLEVFDVENNENPLNVVNAEDGITFSAAAVDPMHQELAAACTSAGAIKLWDYRTGEQCFAINEAHDGPILDISFNESKPYWLCTGGVDGMLKCWDIRSENPKSKYRASSHWVTRAVPSVSHDQLILTAGTDSKVRVFNSNEFAFQVECDLPEGEIIKSIRHDDSVYCATWSRNNAFVFASISYKGQVNLCQLPSQVVDSILMGDNLY